jgi:hypothetical protein
MVLIVGFLVYLELDEQKNFPGRDAVERMIATNDRLTGVEFEPMESPRENSATGSSCMASIASSSRRTWRTSRGRLRVFQAEWPAGRADGVDRHNAVLFAFRSAISA